MILEAVDKYGANMIVTHAEPEGVCAVARKLCEDNSIPLTLHFLNFKFQRGAFEHRSKAVMRDSDVALFIHDGKSKGCANEMKLAEKMKIDHECHVIKPTPYRASVGFDIDADWEWTEDELAKINENAMDEIDFTT